MIRNTINMPLILAVDDKEDNLFVIRQLIEDQFTGCEVITEKDPEKALILASEAIPDAILSDVQMPGVDGIEFCRRLKSNRKTAHIPVILITAFKTTPEIRVMGLDAGADDFLSKPIDNAELIAKIKVMLRIKAAEDKLRDLNLNLENTVLERTGELQESNTRLRKEIKKRKETQKYQSESEQKYRTLFEQSMDAIYVTSVEGDIIDFNKAALDLFGYSKKELFKINAKDLYSDPAEREEFKNEIIGKGTVTNYEIKLKKKDGIVIDCLDTAITIKNKRGKAVGFQGSIRDITEWKKYEKRLKEDREKLVLKLMREKLISDLASMLNESDDFFELMENILEIISKRMSLEQVHVHLFQENKKDITTLQFDRYDQVQLPVQVNMLKRNDISWLIKHFINKNKFESSDVSTLKKSHQVMFKQKDIKAIFILPIRIEGQIKGLFCVSKNRVFKWDTNEKDLIKTLADMISGAFRRHLHFKARLEAEQKQADAMLTLEKASRFSSIGAMASGITHEINQPLTAISFTAESMVYWDKMNPGIIPSEFIDKIKRINEGVDRIDEIIKHMRSFWIINDEKVNIFELNNVIEKAFSLINRQLYSHGIIPEFEQSELQLDIKGNEVQIEQVIINLIAFSMHSLDKISLKDKKIKISTSRDKDFAVMRISDNSLNLSEELLEHLFDPFHTVGKFAEGIELGLAIAERIVKNHYGMVSVNNREHEGIEFMVRLPIIEHSMEKSNENFISR
ncbi:response regulator [candidate division KSB1 bacterium]